jgi:hypothetical protein
VTALLIATAEHRQRMNALRPDHGSMPRSLAQLVAGLIGALGVLGLVTVLLRFEIMLKHCVEPA